MRQLKIKLKKLGTSEVSEIVVNEFDDLLSIEVVPDVNLTGLIPKKFAQTYGGALIDVIESGGKLIQQY